MSTDQDNISESDRNTLMCGVCEGFYGKPWSQEQRRILFGRMERMGLDTYLYAPKDDYKHRLNWRDLYDKDEQEQLRELISVAKDYGVTFVYALSPGLDITFSAKEDVDILKQKLKQVQQFGCEAFALLFDDIDLDLCSEDEASFDTPADAQCVVSNVVYKYLGKPRTFLFCPTEYCNTRAVPDLASSEYLETLGEQLHSGIDILWTGPKVVSRLLTVEAIQDLVAHIRRPPVIWDNLHANDYDQTRLFLGPYEGRPPELLKCLRGVLTNPNCEFEANYIAMHTMAQWRRNTVQNFPLVKKSKDASSEVEMEEDKVPCAATYQPKKALVCAIEDWIPELYKNSSSGTGQPRPVKDTSDSSKSTEMDLEEAEEGKEQTASEKTDKKSSESSTLSSPPSAKSKTNESKQRMDELGPLELQDVLFICDSFYLPYEHGSRAVDLLKRAHWLVDNVERLKDMPKPIQTDANEEVKEWYSRAVAFHERHKEVVLMVDKFVNIPNRDILYQLYEYLNDMRSVLSLVNSYIKWHGMGKPDKEPFRNGDPEPWVHRGGLHAEFRRLLPLEGANDLFPPPISSVQISKVFTVRPYFPSDKADVYSVCRKTCDDGLDGSDIFKDLPELPADECIGAMLEFYPNLCYVLEDDSGLCGYVAVAPDTKDYRQKYTEEWQPSMRQKYPKPETKTDFNLTTSEEMVRSFHQDLPPLPEGLLTKFPSYIQMGLNHKRIDGISTAKRLLKCVTKTLKAHGSHGIFTSMHLSHFRTTAFHCKLGFEELLEEKKPLSDMSILLVKPI